MTDFAELEQDRDEWHGAAIANLMRAEAAEREASELRELVADGIKAFRYTREYVGEETLPAKKNWSWFDWTERAHAAVSTGEDTES
jgi:hypothetical protein